MKSFFVPKDVTQILDLSYRQVQSWDKTNFIKPSYRRKGRYRLYTFTDLFLLKVAAVLRRKGFSIQRLRKTMDVLRNLLPQLSAPLIDTTFLIDDDRILIFNGDVVTDENTEAQYTKFRVLHLRREVDRMFPPVGVGI
jgi:DNA-binding transcriptional MerR regulator